MLVPRCGSFSHSRIARAAKQHNPPQRISIPRVCPGSAAQIKPHDHTVKHRCKSVRGCSSPSFVCLKSRTAANMLVCVYLDSSDSVAIPHCEAPPSTTPPLHLLAMRHMKRRELLPPMLAVCAAMFNACPAHCKAHAGVAPHHYSSCRLPAFQLKAATSTDTGAA